MNYKNIIIAILLTSLLLTGCNSGRPSVDTVETLPANIPIEKDDISEIEYATNKDGDYETDINGNYVEATTEPSTIVITVDPEKENKEINVTDNLYKISASKMTDRVYGYINLYNNEKDMVIAMSPEYANLLYKYCEDIYVDCNTTEYPEEYKELLSDICTLYNYIDVEWCDDNISDDIYNAIWELSQNVAENYIYNNYEDLYNEILNILSEYNLDIDEINAKINENPDEYIMSFEDIFNDEIDIELLDGDINFYDLEGNLILIEKDASIEEIDKELSKYHIDRN